MVTLCTRHLGAKNRISSHLWPLLLIIALSCCAAAPKRQLAGSADETLKKAVEAALARDDRLATAVIAVSAVGGFVELSGTVGSSDEVRRALRLTGDVEGVRGIVNRLRVIGQ